ncbi:hypothetical protein LJC13_00790 [Peptostreptococcaceae bacterium OttesenSCG-928-C18]|nr:hypothetical protein [Peptostreptococcaceae bacterium OttesenSCG-928-C18]
MNIFINIFGGTMLLAAVLLVVFLYQATKNEALKIKNDKVKNAFDDVVEIAFRTVVKLTQTTVKRLKETDKWDSEVAENIFKQALQEIKYQLGQHTLKLLNEKVTDVDTYLKSLIESIVYETKMPGSIDINSILELIKENKQK